MVGSGVSQVVGTENVSDPILRCKLILTVGEGNYDLLGFIGGLPFDQIVVVGIILSRNALPC